MFTFDKISWRVMVWLLGISTPLIASLKPRRFVMADIDLFDSAKDISHSVTIGLYFIFLIIAIISFLVSMTSREKKNEKGTVVAFFLLFLLMASMPTITTLILSGTSEMGILGAIAVFSATYFLPVPQMAWWIREVRVMLLIVFVYGSIAAALFFPEWAWDEKYGFESALAIFPLRLFGTANHANTLAPLAIFAWMLGRFPKCRLGGEIIHGCACLVVTLLAQSKTNMVMGVVLLCTYFFLNMSSWNNVKKYFVYMTVAFTTLFSTLYVINYSSYASKIAIFVNEPQVLTMTGRLPLWVFSVEMWLENPWLGQGVDAWSSKSVLDYLDILGWAAPHAHNQVLQILSQSGMFGLALFVAWICVAVKILRASPIEWRIPLYWLCAFYILNGVTEVVLQYKIALGNTLMTWILFTLILIAGKHKIIEDKLSAL